MPINQINEFLGVGRGIIFLLRFISFKVNPDIEVNIPSTRIALIGTAGYYFEKELWS